MTLGNDDNGTDGQTDRQSATQYAAPSYGGGPHNKTKFLNDTDFIIRLLYILVLMFLVRHINGHFSLLLANMFLSLVAYDNL